MVNFASRHAKFWLIYFYYKYSIYIQNNMYIYIYIMLYRLGYIKVYKIRLYIFKILNIAF